VLPVGRRKVGRLRTTGAEWNRRKGMKNWVERFEKRLVKL